METTGNWKVDQMSETDRAKLTAEIEAEIRSEGGSCSVSSIRTNVITRAWRGIGCQDDLEKIIKALGFRVQRGVNSRGQRRMEVTLPNAERSGRYQEGIKQEEAKA